VPLAVRLVQRSYDCYGSGDLDTMRNEVLASHVVWRIPGRHPLSGVKLGADEIVAFFAELAKAKMQAEVVFMAGDDAHVVDVHRGWGATHAARMDMLWVLYYRIENGRIAEVTNFAADQAQADNFFWASYQLAPLPQRLA
jgi:ketosteroid isomerase-like protein